MLRSVLDSWQLLRYGDPDGNIHNSLGIVLLIASVFFFTLMDATAKHLIHSYPTVQVIWVRFLGNFILIVAFLRGRSLAALRSRQPLIQIGRAATQMLALTCFFFALRWIGLAEATAIAEINPALIVLFAVIFLGEKLGIKRIIAIAMALLGALVIIRPGMGVFQPAALLPMLGALSYAMGAVLTRMARFDSIETSLLWAVGIGTTVFALAMPFVWQPIAAGDLWAFVLVGVWGSLGQALLIRAFTLAEASAIAPFDYTGLLWAGLWGWLFFAAVPDGWTVIGALIIVAAGLYIWLNETRRPTITNRRPDG